MVNDHREAAGYRVNAKRYPSRTAQGLVSVFAERKNENPVLGLYGGDAVPIASEWEREGIKYGVVIAADGVGNAGYPHPSLKCALSSAEGDAEKLSLFLRTLYGSDFFEDDEAVEYALRSFSPVPSDGWFVAQREDWQRAENAQTELPFYERDSQSLGSRILTVGIYHKFRKFALERGLSSWDKSSAAELKGAIEAYIGEKETLLEGEGELKSNVLKLFDYRDAPSTDRRERYFLASTFAAWFYIEKDGIVSALSLNQGDARCYLCDLTDGVMQISTDDAFPNNDMSAFVHFGAAPRTTGGYTDGSFHCRLVTVKAPCALLACSDGIYDTCPGADPDADKEGGRAMLGYGTEDSSDFHFEKNLLDILRSSYSFDDFERRVIYILYAQGKAQDSMEYYTGRHFSHIKRDDSGTLAARFFPLGKMTLMEGLRGKDTQTTLDRLYSLLEEKYREGVEIPYFPPHVVTDDELKKSEREDLARDPDFGELISLLKARYTAAFAAMQRTGEGEVWNIPQGEQPLVGFSLNKTFNTLSARLAVLSVLEDDLSDIERGADTSAWKEEPHKHVVINNEEKEKAMPLLARIKEIDKSADPAAERALALFKWFEDARMGRTDTEAGYGREIDLEALDKLLDR